jgi:hypothetical protein
MKIAKSTIWAFILLILTASLYRVWDSRPFGFAPQMAMALFGGAVIKDKRLALFLPLICLLISDSLYQILFNYGLSPIKGFYRGQVWNYGLFACITLFGMLMKRVNLKNVLGFTISGSVIFFLLSNFGVWIGGGGYVRPKTFEGLLQCYGDALVFHRDYGLIKGFYGNQIIGDLFFSLLLFGAYYFITKAAVSTKSVATQ